jgi:tyrosinase
MVDKVWSDWQHKNKANFWSYHGGSVQPFQSASDYEANPNGDEPNLNVRITLLYSFKSDPLFSVTMQFGSEIPMDGLWEGYTVYDVMDTTEGPLCYIYE